MPDPTLEEQLAHIEEELSRLACTDNNCVVTTNGAGTNGGCDCLEPLRKNHHYLMQKIKHVLNLRKQQAKLLGRR